MPLGESMLSVVKSNKRIMLDKSKHFRRNHSGYSKPSKVTYDFPKASPEILSEIKIKYSKQRKKARIKSAVVLCVLAVGIYVFYWFMLKPFLFG